MWIQPLSTRTERPEGGVVVRVGAEIRVVGGSSRELAKRSREGSRPRLLSHRLTELFERSYYLVRVIRRLAYVIRNFACEDE